MNEKLREKIEIVLASTISVVTLGYLISSPQSQSSNASKTSVIFPKNKIEVLNKSNSSPQVSEEIFYTEGSSFEFPEVGSTISPIEMLELLQSKFPDLKFETEVQPKEAQTDEEHWDLEMLMIYFRPRSQVNVSKVSKDKLSIYHSFDENSEIEDFQINKDHVDLIHLQFRDRRFSDLILDCGIATGIELSFNGSMAMDNYNIGHFHERKIGKIDPSVKPFCTEYMGKVESLLQQLCIDYQDMKACEAFKEISQIKDFKKI